MALKQAEDADNQWIVRGYECCGESAESQLQCALPFQPIGIVDGLERLVEQDAESILASAIAMLGTDQLAKGTVWVRPAPKTRSQMIAQLQKHDRSPQPQRTIAVSNPSSIEILAENSVIWLNC
jgi:Glycosyl hydrolases family 38 C-terminal beta sandwich domain